MQKDELKGNKPPRIPRNINKIGCRHSVIILIYRYYKEWLKKLITERR